MIHTIGVTRQCLKGQRVPMVLDCRGNAPSRVCLGRPCEHISVRSPPASGHKSLPELTQSMASHGVLIHVKDVSAEGG